MTSKRHVFVCIEDDPSVDRLRQGIRQKEGNILGTQTNDTMTVNTPS